MAREIHIKQGAALRLTMNFYEHDAPVDLSTVTLSSQVRTSLNILVATLPITITGTPGLATVEVDNTTNWPVGLLRCDVLALIAGVPSLTDTFPIRVERSVTQ
jgi:hypothetical protein